MLLANVRIGLLNGLQRIFFASAVIMTLAIILHIVLRDVPLRRHHAPEPEIPVGLKVALLPPRINRTTTVRERERNHMQQVALGSLGLKVSRMGLGCMGMSEFYGSTDDTESIATIHLALDRGMNFLDTADMYGPFKNEVLVGKAIQGRRNEVVLATKFGNQRSPDGKFLGVNGSPEYVRACCEASLQRLNVEVIDLYYQHRVDPKTPIEDTVGAMADLVKQGKVRYLGPVGSRARHHPARSSRASHQCAADRVFALDARSGGRYPGHRSRARHRLSWRTARSAAAF